jgi:hypothetical protein
MATLKATGRKRIPTKSFGLPGKAKSPKAKAQSGNYPMPDRSHAANAKARAKQQLNAGRLSKGQYSQIVAKANRKLGS